MFKNLSFLLVIFLVAPYSGLVVGDSLSFEKQSKTNPMDQSLSAMGWLKKMTQGFRQQDYQGVFVYGQPNRVETFNIAHSFRDGIERERLSFLNGPEREIIREGGEVTCVYSDEQVVTLKQDQDLPFASEFATSLSRVSQFYHLALGNPDRIAGFKVVQVTMEPMDRFRYGYQLWLLNDSRYPNHQGLLIKSEMIDSQKKTLELFQFTQLDLINPIPPSWFDKEIALPNHYQPLEAPMGLEPVSWSLQWVPGGFMKSNKMVAKGKGSRGGERLVFTDGLTTFTVFVEKLKSGEMAPTGNQSMGATVAHMTMRTLEGQNYRVTIVGEVPLATARKVAQSIAMK